MTPRSSPMRVVLSDRFYNELGLDDPGAMLRARAAFYLGRGPSAVRLLVAGGVYAAEAEKIVELAIWLGMSDLDVVIRG